MTLRIMTVLVLPWLLFLAVLLYSRLPRKHGGYWETTVGALKGGGGCAVIAGLIGYQLSDYLSRDESYPIPGIWAVPFMVVGITVGETLGSWYALHHARFAGAGLTALILASLLLTLFIGGSTLLIVDNRIDDSLFLPATSVLFLPPLARWLALRFDARWESQ